MKNRATGSEDKTPTGPRGGSGVLPPRGPVLEGGASGHSLDLPDAGGLSKLRERLRSLRYSEEGVAGRLRIWHITAMTLPEYPIYRERLRQRPDALSAVISLFLLQGEVRREAADDALGADVVEELLRCGLLTRAGDGEVAAAFSIYPCSRSYFITDHHFWPATRGDLAAPDQPVMHFGQDSYALAYLAAQPPKGARVLDMCTGSGVHAILAARRADSAVGVDINPRAVELARFNAALNGVAARCDFSRGHLYDALGSGAVVPDDERFDLIVANPPFIPTPRSGAGRFLFQDAGPTGEEILRPVIAGLPGHLKPGGTAAIISLFAVQKRSHYKTKIRRWIGTRTPAELLLLDIYTVDPEELAFCCAWREFGDNFAAYAQRYEEWLDALRSSQIVRLTFGVLVVRMGMRGGFRAVKLPLSQALRAVPERSSPGRLLPRQLSDYAATPKGLAMNFACPAASLPPRPPSARRPFP